MNFYYWVNQWLRLIPAYRRRDDRRLERMNAVCKSFYRGPIQ